MEYKQSRICDCWLDVGSCFCELNIKSNEGKDINTVAKESSESGGNSKSSAGTNSRNERYLDWDARDLEANGWVRRSSEQTQGGQQFRFWE